MGLWDQFKHAMALEPWAHQPIKTLAVDPTTMAERIAVLRARQFADRPWRPATVDEALAVPALYQAVTLISNLVGTFTLRGYLNGELVPDDQRPRLIVRPNPFATPRDFLRETAWSMATRGEGWWWEAARDTDNNVISLVPVPTYEVRIEGDDWLKPKVLWRNDDKTKDMKQLVLNRELGTTRGFGPLQKCGAAISAAVESQEWAANFYAAGGNPSVHIHSEIELEQDEAAALRDAWGGNPSNMPQVTSGPINISEFGTGISEGAAQMLDTRMYNAGEAARMFGIPGALLEYSRQGSSLTYANIESLFDQLLKGCLIPNYLEPIEQAISDLLPRNWTAKFNVDNITRADIKTRFDVYKTGTESGVLTVEEARAIEGLAGSNVENAPVAPSPPQAVPTSFPQGVGINGGYLSRGEWRCESCNKKFALVRGTGTTIECERCGTLAVA
jgi:HK97 family phage portal protein